MPGVRIGQRTVGAGERCYIVAEAGANHDRDLATAHRLVDVAADAGADAVKFQTYTGRDLYSTRAPRFDYLGSLGDRPVHELLDDLALPREWQPELAAHAAERGIEFLSSPFDRRAVDELDELGVAAFKVASFEIVDLGLLRHVGSKGRPVILSTGMADLGEIEAAITALRSDSEIDVCLLQCASLYPAPVETLNLRSIPMLEAAFGCPVGLSDHSLGIHVAPAAVALGARLVEKHITLDRTSEGPDHPFAVEPAELDALVAHVRDVESALGDGQKHGPNSLESVEMYRKARRSLVAACDIPAGTRLDADMITVKRPGHGIEPRLIDVVVGRTASVDIAEDEVLVWEML
ncbi:MAG: N-acetylneuraminate synthase family protein [Actinobacteria bacterium]|nr:N-acetylneuraminate synthase family protein [Actinomycetota bacterium]